MQTESKNLKIKKWKKFAPVPAMHGDVDLQLHSFLT